MILYHGTNATIQNIDLNQSRVGKDFGLGFYLTTDEQVAIRQAARKLEQFGEGEALMKPKHKTLMCSNLKNTRWTGPGLF